MASIYHSIHTPECSAKQGFRLGYSQQGENLKIAAEAPYDPEDCARLGNILDHTGPWMEKEVVSNVHGLDIKLIWGDSDLYFSQSGFENLADKQKQNENRVTTLTLKDSGHMVLFDNGEEQTKKIILNKLVGH